MNRKLEVVPFSDKNPYYLLNSNKRPATKESAHVLIQTKTSNGWFKAWYDYSTDRFYSTFRSITSPIIAWQHLPNLVPETEFEWFKQQFKLEWTWDESMGEVRDERYVWEAYIYGHKFQYEQDINFEEAYARWVFHNRKK